MQNSTIVEVKLKSLIDQTLNTGIVSIELVKDEIFRTKFKNQMCVDNLIALGGIVETVPSIVALSKHIPVILPPIVLYDEEGHPLPLTSVVSEISNLEVDDMSEFFGERTN